MNEDQEVSRLRAAKEDVLRRGFATLTCLPNAKDPYPKYSPHAVNSATKDPAIALRPYDDGVPANFGVAPGLSGHSVVDIDSGIDSIASLEAWKKKNNLSDTFTVITGRDPFGAHLYYDGVQDTHPFELDGVTGEVRSTGAYVVGPGSKHPSGRLYRIHKDIPTVALPDVFKKKKAKPKPVSVKDSDIELIPEGQRNGRLTSLAGSLRNLGLSEVGILAGIEDFCRNRCTDGDAYADTNENKLRDMAHRAARWDIAAPGEIVFLPRVTTGLGIRRALEANAKRDGMRDGGIQ